MIMICQTFGHMRIDFPTIRMKYATGGQMISWERWKQKDPVYPAHPEDGLCRGMIADAVPEENEFDAGDVIQVRLDGTAVHGGGHCTLWYSVAAEDYELVKILDVKDCTLAKHNTFPVQLPTDMPKQCEQRCTFVWTWIPVDSGQCEFYMNCADIKVFGVSGQYENDAVRVNILSLYDGMVQEPNNPAKQCKRVEYVAIFY